MGRVDRPERSEGRDGRGDCSAPGGLHPTRHAAFGVGPPSPSRGGRETSDFRPPRDDSEGATPMKGRLSPFNLISLVLGFAFLYLPIVILVVYSFNASKLV